MPGCNLHGNYNYSLFMCKHTQTSTGRYLQLYNPCSRNHNTETSVGKLTSLHGTGLSKIKYIHQRNWNGNEWITMKQCACSAVIFCREGSPYLHLACVDCSLRWSPGRWAEPRVNKAIYNEQPSGQAAGWTRLYCLPLAEEICSTVDKYSLNKQKIYQPL